MHRQIFKREGMFSESDVRRGWGDWRRKKHLQKHTKGEIETENDYTVAAGKSEDLFLCSGSSHLILEQDSVIFKQTRICSDIIDIYWGDDAKNQTICWTVGLKFSIHILKPAEYCYCCSFCSSIHFSPHRPWPQPIKADGCSLWTQCYLRFLP